MRALVWNVVMQYQLQSLWGNGWDGHEENHSQALVVDLSPWGWSLNTQFLSTVKTFKKTKQIIHIINKKFTYKI